MRVVLLVLFLFGGALPAQAQLRITNDPGGVIEKYIDRFNYIRATGQPIIVDGSCASACTLIMRYVPRDRVCVTNRAVFGFHAASYRLALTGQYVGPNAEGTKFMMNSYPPVVRRWIIRNGGLKQNVIWMPAHALNGFYRRC